MFRFQGGGSGLNNDINGLNLARNEFVFYKFKRLIKKL